MVNEQYLIEEVYERALAEQYDTDSDETNHDCSDEKSSVLI